jgi:hypothetical protein
MLQRQVYRGGPAPMAGADPGSAVNAEIRMDRMESQMRDLTGRVEEFMNQVERLRQRVDQVNGDTETRLGQAPPSQGGYASAGPPPSPPRTRGGPSARELADPPGPSGTLTPPGMPPGARLLPEGPSRSPAR